MVKTNVTEVSSVKNISPDVEEVYNQAANEGTLDLQIDQMGELAAEFGTSLEALASARRARELEAAERMKLDPNAVAASNEGDDWRNNEER